MPYAGSDFPNAQIGETVTYFFDFTNTLAVGETISSVTWTAATAADSTVSDPGAAGIVSGSPSIVGNIVGQKFSGMLGSVKYLIQANINTNAGNLLETYSHFFTEIPT